MLAFLLYSLINLQVALPTFVVEQSDFSADLSPYVEVYEDPSASLTVSEVNEQYRQGRFFRPESGGLSFGLSSSTYWFRFAVDATNQGDYPMLLDVGNPLLDKAQLYIAEQGETTAFQSVKGPPIGRNVVFPMAPTLTPITTYYIEIRSEAPIRVPLTLNSPAEYRNKIVTDYLILGLFYGICFGLGFFNLFLYLSTREKSYLSYVLFVGSTFAYNLTVDGFVSVAWLDARFAVVALIALQVSAIAQLVRNFFELSSQAPSLDHLCRATSIGALLIIPLAWVFGADAFIGPVHIYLLPAGLLLLLVSLKRLQAGFKPAIYFLVAWIGLIAIVIALTLDVLGIISFKYSAYGLKIGILSQLLLFSFALGGRLNGLNKTLGAEIKQRAANELALRESEKRWRGLSEAAFEGILIFENGLIKEINHSMKDIMGGFPDSLIGSEGMQLLAPEYFEAAQEWVSSGASEPKELQLRRPDGTRFYAEVNVRSDLMGGEGAGIQVVVVRDITQRKSHEDKLRKMAQYDALTSLPNRVLFNERLGHAVTAAKRKDKQHAVLFIDLDRFKNVNDSLGHSVGDELLIEVAQRLKCGTRPEDTVARLGGDEFAILLEDIGAPRIAAKVAQKIIDQLMEPVAIAGHELVTTPSIGIALYPDNGGSVEELLRNADTAMYRAKANGRNCYQFFTRDMDNQMLQRLKLESDIRHALQFRQFILHFQPQICFSSGQVIGAEALVRWDAGLSGIRFPDEFIGVAEETGLIVPLGEQVIEMACEQLALWNKQGIHLPNLSINLSSKQFCYANIIPSIEAILERTGVPANQLLLEITEAAMMDDEKRAIGVMNRLKEMGIQLAIDDFGTGYSSLSYLKNFPLDELKIDRSFINEMVENEADRRIVASIVDLARHLDLRVIAEGIETLPQAELLSSMNCENMQGYLFSKPITPDHFIELVQERRADYVNRQSS